MEGPSPGLLPGNGVRRQHGVATRLALRMALYLELREFDGDPTGDWGHGSTRNGRRDGSYHRRTTRARRRARRTSYRSRCHRGRVAADRASDWAGMIATSKRTLRVGCYCFSCGTSSPNVISVLALKLARRYE